MCTRGQLAALIWARLGSELQRWREKGARTAVVEVFGPANKQQTPVTAS